MAGRTITALRRRTQDGARDDEQPGTHTGSQVQRRSLLRAAGRAVLWLFILVVIVRGIGAVLSDDEPAAPVVRETAAEQQFPNSEARTFAEQFARTYLTFAPGRGESYAARIAPYLAEGVRDSAALQLPERGATQTATAASVSRVNVVGDGQALITVAVNVTRTTPDRTERIGRGKRRRTRTIQGKTTTATSYLTVPIYRDSRGGLSVFDLPSFTAPPARAADYKQETTQLQGSSGETGAINDLIGKFLPVYLSGRADQLSFYLPAGTHITPLGSDLEVQRVVEVQQIGESTGPTRKLIVHALVRDPTTRAVFPLRYRIDVVRRDRWYVQKVEGGGP